MSKIGLTLEGASIILKEAFFEVENILKKVIC